MKTPEKQADRITTVGRSPQASSTICESPAGERMRSPTTIPAGEPWEVK